MQGNSDTARREQFAESLADKEYRDLVVEANIRNGVAFQIRATREDRGWSQGELGQRIGTTQDVISQLEDPSYGRLTVKTLLRLASVFDVALVVKFIPFSALVDQLAEISPADIAVIGFDDDIAQEDSWERG